LLLDSAFYFELEKDEACKSAATMATTIRENWEGLCRELGMTDMEVREYRLAFEHPEMDYAEGLGKPQVFVTSSLASLTPKALVQHVITANLDPRAEALKKALPEDTDIKEIQNLLRQAASNPKAWGIDKSVLKAWGEKHSIGRIRKNTAPLSSKKEIVYDDF
jgi:hypothetical protein